MINIFWTLFPFMMLITPCGSSLSLVSSVAEPDKAGIVVMEAAGKSEGDLK